MKKDKLNLLVLSSLLICVIYLSSCGGNNKQQQFKPVMNCMINSATWRTADPHARVSENSIVIYGTSANGQTIQLRLFAGEQGEYTLNQQNRHEGKYIPNMSTTATHYSTNNDPSGTGYVYVNSINEESKTISGAFSFKAYREDGTFKSITDGKFTNVPYKFISSIDTATFDNKMLANIGSNSWHASQVTAVKNDTAIIITGIIQETWEKLKLIIPNNTGAGVHTITLNGPVYAIFEQGFNIYKGNAGSVTIGEHDQNRQIIRGTFFFNFVNEGGVTISITSGQFEVLYTN